MPEPSAPPAMHGAVLVVIPTLNEATHIGQVLQALRQDLPPATQVDFVVADGGSTDGTQQIVLDLARELAAQHAASAAGSSSPNALPTLKLLHNPQRIQSAAVNLAVRHHGDGHDVLVRCDAHADYPRSYIRKLTTSLRSSGADAVVVPMDTRPAEPGSCVQRAIAWVSDTPMGSGGSAHRGGRRSGFVDHGHHAAFRMDSFRRAGGYNESYTHNEDAELDCRQRALGSRIYLDANVRLGYFPRTRLSSLARQYFAYGLGRSRTVRRHPGSMRARQLAVPAHLLLCLAGVLGAAWLPLLATWPALYLAAVLATSTGVAWQHRALCGLWAGPAAATMHFSWACGFFWGLLSLREPPWRPAAERPLAGNADIAHSS